VSTLSSHPNPSGIFGGWNQSSTSLAEMEFLIPKQSNMAVELATFRNLIPPFVFDFFCGQPQYKGYNGLAHCPLTKLPGRHIWRCKDCTRHADGTQLALGEFESESILDRRELN
jgi:hypothetical protein